MTSLLQAQDNLRQLSLRPNWYSHLAQVNAAMAEADRIFDLRTAAGWDGDEGGWYGPHPETGEMIPESEWEDLGLPLPEDAS